MFNLLSVRFARIDFQTSFDLLFLWSCWSWQLHQKWITLPFYTKMEYKSSPSSQQEKNWVLKLTIVPQKSYRYRDISHAICNSITFFLPLDNKKICNILKFDIFFSHICMPYRKYIGIWPSLARVLHSSMCCLWQPEFSMRCSMLWLLLWESGLRLKHFSREVSGCSLGSSFILCLLLFPRVSMNVFMDNILPWNAWKECRTEHPVFILKNMQLKSTYSFVQDFQQLHILFCNEILIHDLVTERIIEK